MNKNSKVIRRRAKELVVSDKGPRSRRGKNSDIKGEISAVVQALQANRPTG